MVSTFNNYNNSVSQYGNGWLTIFDIDDTLFKTTANVLVRNRDGEVIASLTSAEYNTYSLKTGETFDFEEFKNAEKFYKESKPIGRMLQRAKLILAASEKYPLSRVIIITARTDFDSKSVFLKTFRKYGFDIDKVRVERAGNLGSVGSGASRKAMITRKYLETRSFNKVRIFDDDIANLMAILKLRKEFPFISFSAYLAKEDGSVKTISS